MSMLSITHKILRYQGMELSDRQLAGLRADLARSHEIGSQNTRLALVRRGQMDEEGRIDWLAMYDRRETRGL